MTDKRRGPPPKGVTWGPGSKFDMQLSQSLIYERRLAEIFSAKLIEKIEQKSESYLWERTGNICIEFRQCGKPSGIAVTEADCWVHELVRDGETVVYLMFPIKRLKELARRHLRAGHVRRGTGDRGEYDNILIPLSEILK